MSSFIYHLPHSKKRVHIWDGIQLINTHFLWSALFMIFHFISEINRCVIVCENKSEIKISFLTILYHISLYSHGVWRIIKGGCLKIIECIVCRLYMGYMLKGKTFETHYKSLPIVKNISCSLGSCNNKSQTTFQIIIIIVIMMMKSLSLSLSLTLSPFLLLNCLKRKRK